MTKLDINNVKIKYRIAIEFIFKLIPCMQNIPNNAVTEIPFVDVKFNSHLNE